MDILYLIAMEFCMVVGICGGWFMRGIIQDCKTRKFKEDDDAIILVIWAVVIIASILLIGKAGKAI